MKRERLPGPPVAVGPSTALAAAVVRAAMLAAMMAAMPAVAQKRPAGEAAAAPIEGTVLRVIDGDTLVLQVADRAPMDVRLKDMDAPEICQPHGPQAKQALEEFALGKAASVVTVGRDSYGRYVGAVTVDGRSLARRMVEEGHAWSVRFKWDNGPLVKQERQAKALGRGLHASAGAVMPKDFRKAHGACKPPPKA